MEKDPHDRWLKWICETLPDIRRGYWFNDQLDVVACWPPQVTVPDDARDVARLAVKQQAFTFSNLTLADQSCCVLAQPLRKNFGALAFITAQSASQPNLQRLAGWASDWLGELLDVSSEHAGSSDLLFHYLQHRELDTRARLEQVALYAQRHWKLNAYLLTDEQCRPLGDSDPDVLGESALNDLLNADWDAHPVLERERAGCCCLAVAVRSQDPPLFLLLCRNTKNQAAAFSDVERKQLEILALLIDGMPKRLASAGPVSWWKRKWAGIGAVGLLLIFIFLWPVEYRLSTGATLEGGEQHAVVAPFDGFISQVNFRAGDRVEKGAAILRMDTRDPLLASQKLEAEIQEFQKEYRKDLALKELAGAMVWRERLQQSRIELQLVREQLERAVITAPFTGHLISGNLNYKLNAPVKKGEVLYEISSLHGYRVLLEVAETDIRFLASGQPGELQLRALPEDQVAITVTKILPVPLREHDTQSYLAEAVMADDKGVDGLQPGMEGVAKVSIGKSTLAWIGFHHLVDWLRVQWWLWTP